MSIGYSESTADRLFKGVDNSPSSIARLGASPPSDELPPPGRQAHLPAAQSHHDYSWQLQTLAPNGLAPHPGSPVNGRLLPELILEVRRGVLLRPSRGASSQATSIGSGASVAAPWVSGAWLSTGTASGIVLPSASAPVNKNTMGVTLGGYNYSLRIPALVQCTHLLRC
jgi:hypothetical protein